MARYVPDINTQRWVVISPSRVKRPNGASKIIDTHINGKIIGNAPVCPFCAGSEHLTPPEVYRIGTGEKDGVGWDVRVVPNKFPITDIHEVIIHSSHHTNDLENLPIEQVTKIMQTYRDRYRAHEASGQVLIFCNHGFSAGASLVHPHSQLVVIPRQINLDAVSLEPVTNIVDENDKFVTYCPDFSQWPYEVWISPKEKSNKFGDVVDADIPILSKALQSALQRIDKVLTDPVQPLKQVNEPFVYNYYIYHGNNWFIRITPRAVHRAGFELGTGLNVNVVDPAEAASRLAAVVLT